IYRNDETPVFADMTPSSYMIFTVINSRQHDIMKLMLQLSKIFHCRHRILYVQSLALSDFHPRQGMHDSKVIRYFLDQKIPYSSSPILFFLPLIYNFIRQSVHEWRMCPMPAMRRRKMPKPM